MNDLPRHALSRIIAKYGRGICDSPKRVEALLRDLCGGNRREINIIMGALEERVAADLVAAGDSVPRDLLLARLAARLRDNLAYTSEAARWGVETWAVALGLASEAELQRGSGAAAGEADAGASPPAAGDSKPARPTPPGDSQPAPQPRRGAPSPPPPRPQRSSPPPSTYSPPAPPPRRSPPATPPKVVLPAALPPTALPPNQRPLPTPRPTPRRGLRLRGCLIIIALILVLVVAAIFAIPAVIVLLQEEQSRPSINEPRVR